MKEDIQKNKSKNIQILLADVEDSEEFQALDLSPKQKVFISTYCTNGFNGRDAVEKCGFNNNTAISKSSHAHVLTHNPKIKEGIKIFLSSFISKKRETLEYEILHTLYMRAFYDISMFINTDGSPKFKDISDLGVWSCCIDNIKQKPLYDGVVAIHVEMANRDKALDTLAKYINFFVTGGKKGDTINNYGVMVVPSISENSKKWENGE